MLRTRNTYGSRVSLVEAFGEYRVGHGNNGAHRIECRGEVIAEVHNPPDGPPKAWRYGGDDMVWITSSIPGWQFERYARSVGHALSAAARSHRQFVEPNAVKRLWREMALWPAWGKVAALVVLLAAISEILSYFAPNVGTQLVRWLAELVSGLSEWAAVESPGTERSLR